MNKIYFVVAILVTTYTQKTFAQDITPQSQAPQLLSFYYNIKDALVAGNASTTAANAQAFVKATNGIDPKSISESNITTLANYAAAIAKSDDIKEQRLHFPDLSISLFAVAKSVKLTDQPIYEAFCPMKKAYWLSSFKTVKNPYFGNAMLNCGKVVETFN